MQVEQFIYPDAEYGIRMAYVSLNTFDSLQN